MNKGGKKGKGRIKEKNKQLSPVTSHHLPSRLFRLSNPKAKTTVIYIYIIIIVHI